MAKIKICLDAGHYGRYNVSPADSRYVESEAMWAHHLKLKKYLEQYGFEVITTRSDQKKDLELTARGKVSKGCALFLSLHSNAVDGNVHENIDYPVVYVPLNGTGDKIGKKLADCIASTMGTKQKGRIETRKGNHGDYYGVIRGAVAVGTPGLILEHSFHSNTAATRWLLDESNMDRMARAEAAVIADHFGIKAPVNTESATSTSASGKGDVMQYVVQVGAYSVEKNAKAQLEKVKKAGFADAFIASDGKTHRVQVGAFAIRSNATTLLNQVKKAGFDAIINTKKATAPKKSNEEIAKEVAAGKWGNGEDRKKKLTAAGYDYATIQKLVNKLLG